MPELPDWSDLTPGVNIPREMSWAFLVDLVQIDGTIIPLWACSICGAAVPSGKHERQHLLWHGPEA